MFFINFFRDEIIDSSISDLGDDAPAFEIEAYLGTILSSNSAAYFTFRYFDALREIEKLVDGLVENYEALADEVIDELASKRDLIADSSTYTESMRQHLENARPYFKPGPMKQLADMIQEIDNALSKESAIQRLDKHAETKRS